MEVIGNGGRADYGGWVWGVGQMVTNKAIFKDLQLRVPVLAFGHPGLGVFSGLGHSDNYNY